MCNAEELIELQREENVLHAQSIMFQLHLFAKGNLIVELTKFITINMSVLFAQNIQDLKIINGNVMQTRVHLGIE